MEIFVGIDVCEKKLDIFLHPIKEINQFDNTKLGISKLCRYLEQFKIEQIAMEATGKLEAICAKKLIESGYKASVVNPAQVCYFRRSLGRKNKTDVVDAEIIAKFCEVMRPALTEVLSAEQENLRELSARRQQLLTQVQMEHNRLRRVREDYCKKDLEQHINFLDKKLHKIEDMILLIISNNKSLARKYEILVSVPGIGKILAIAMICNFPELGSLNYKQVASLAGVIPLNQESGQMFGHKKMRYNGRKVIRANLYLAVLVAMRYNDFIRHHYERLLGNGKAKKLAMGACMRKMIIVINSLIKENRCWNENKH